MKNYIRFYFSLFVLSVIGLISVLPSTKATATTDQNLPPKSNYYSWYSPEIAENILTAICKGEYYRHLDFNGDSQLTISDSVAVLRRYYYNIENGVTLIFSQKDIDEIAAENGLDIIYWEIDFANSRPCRRYEYTADTVQTIHIYYETPEISDGFYVELNPYEERIQVK